MLTIAEINDLDRLDGYSLLWKELLGKTRPGSFFQSLEWLKSYWKHFGASQKLRVLIASVAGRPIGIMPLIVKRVESRLGTIRVLSYPLDSWGPFYGPIGPNPAATLATAMKHLQETRRDWDLIDVRYVDTDGCDRGRTPNAMRGRGFQSYSRPWGQTVTVDLDGDWTKYWKGHSSEFHSRYQRAEQTLRKFGPVRLVRFRPQSVACGNVDLGWNLYDALETMTRRKHQTGSGFRGSNFRAADARFLRDTHSAAVRAGAVDLSVLYLGRNPVAGAYCYHWDGRIEAVRCGLDAAAPPETATVFLGRMLRDGAERGDRSYMFPEEHIISSDGWQTSLTTSYRYTHFARAVPRAQMLRLNHCLNRWLDQKPSTTNSRPASAALRPANDTKLSVVGM